MPSPSGRPNTLPYHKPNCQCPPCKRKAKAGSGSTGKAAAAEARLPELSSQTPEVLVAPGTVENIPVLVDDRSLEARTLQIVALKAKGLNNKQIAQKLGLAHTTVRNIIWQANRKRLIKYDDPYERFEQTLVPMVVDNIEHWLSEAGGRDKKMTIEAAKGAGLFKSHQALKVEGERQTTVLALKIEMPPQIAQLPPTEMSKLAVGQVVGKPRRALEGVVVGEEGTDDNGN